MKMTLNITGKDITEILCTAFNLLNSRLDSNQTGWRGDAHYDLYFTDTNDLWDDNPNLECINPYGKEDGEEE